MSPSNSRRLWDRSAPDDPASFDRIVDLAEEAKCRLSTGDAQQWKSILPTASGEIEVTREEFEESTGDLLERTSHTTREVLDAAQLAWRDIQHILLVGGSTRMPAVTQMLEELSGITPQHAVHPDEAVGACRHLRRLSTGTSRIDGPHAPRFANHRCQFAQPGDRRS